MEDFFKKPKDEAFKQAVDSFKEEINSDSFDWEMFFEVLIEDGTDEDENQLNPFRAHSLFSKNFFRKVELYFSAEAMYLNFIKVNKPLDDESEDKKEMKEDIKDQEEDQTETEEIGKE